MAVRTRVESIARDVEVALSEELSPQAQSRALAQFAREQIDEAKQTNRAALGRVPRYVVAVDGRAGGLLDEVRPDGVIVAEFEVLNDALAWIGEQLLHHSPVRSGRYQASHTLLADGVEIEWGATIPAAEEYVFINTQPYARKIEAGRSSQAPDGVYQAVATLAARRFGNIAKITFGYRVPLFGAVHGWANSASAARHAARNRRHAGATSSSRAEWLRRQPAIIVRTPR